MPARLPTAYLFDPRRAPPKYGDALVAAPKRRVEARVVPFHVPRWVRALNRVLWCAAAGVGVAVLLAAPPAFLLGGGAIAMVYRS